MRGSRTAGRPPTACYAPAAMPPTPTLADQVSRLYDLVAGYHATHLMEIARELGVWEALTRDPGLASRELADRLGTDPFYIIPRVNFGAPTSVIATLAYNFLPPAPGERGLGKRVEYNDSYPPSSMIT